MPPPHTLAAGRLGGMSIAFLAIAAVTPLSVVAMVVPLAYADGGPLALPLLFLGLGLLLLVFATGYVAMSRRMPHAGALYCFIARGLGRPLGIGAAWLALLAYTALQAGLYALAGAAVEPPAAVPWWAVALGCWAVVALCGLLRVTVTARLLLVLVPAEAAVILGYSLADVTQPAGGRLTWAAWDPANLSGLPRPALGILLVLVALAFAGFETTAAYAEEARGPRRAIARATYLSIVVLAVLFAAASWAMTVATGPDRIGAEAGARGPELMFDLAAARLAPWAVTLGRVVLVAGLLAAMIALHQTVSRYLFALGRERVLPPGLGRTGLRTSAPGAASLTQTVVVGLVIGGGALAGADPATAARVLGVGGGLCVLLLLIGASLAALMYLNRHPNGEGVATRLLAPGLSTVALGALAYLAFADLPALLGVPDRVVLPAVAGGTVLLGVVYGLVLRGAAPVTYASIGLGGAAVVVTPSVAVVRPVPRQRQPGAHRPERVNREELTG
ncbi:amino acid permease [Amorphoplanes digitatis]|uniref:Amino acid transporter n=1 Tax=Actinoplanes digitatis TaxID=1868 RepID=A0A7W7I5F6_9ACTN|nr:APC family permease [Actinoplanes digitatis]MBB4766794.1 amino acid transporter [Actinoplanes digitatis]